MKKNVIVVPKKFSFTIDDIVALKKAEVFLRDWKLCIDDRLFSEGYDMRDGLLYEMMALSPIDTETYWRLRKARGLRGFR
jgi:hypothetical protein